MSLPPFKHFGTDAIHAGQEPEPRTGAVVVPISLASTFAQKSPGEHTGYEYARSGNPTRQAFEEQVAAAEGGKFGFAFASGLATTNTIVSMLRSGDHIVCEEDAYGGTHRLFARILATHDVECTFVDFRDLAAIQAAITPKTRMMWVESPTNPLLKMSDIAAVAAVAKSKDLIMVVDNTFITPYFQRPLSLGATIVMHSISKYINGHSDVIGGVAVTNDPAIAERLRFLQNAMGAIMSPFDSYMVSRGLKTLKVRMEAHQANAMAAAKFLEAHPKVDRVLYPGLPSHPDYATGLKQMTGFGGMITVFLKGGLQEAKTFLENLKVITLAESLGGIESLAEHPAIMTHASVPPEHRAKIGITDSLVRISIGIEDQEDLLKDLSDALDAI